MLARSGTRSYDNMWRQPHAMSPLSGRRVAMADEVEDKFFAKIGKYTKRNKNRRKN